MIRNGREPGLQPFWNVPYPRNPHFTGRNEILETLHRRLSEGERACSVVPIRGLGGIGKTQTEVEYAYRYRGEYKYVFWARAQTALELTTTFRKIAKRLEIPLEADSSDAEVRALKRWLATKLH